MKCIQDQCSAALTAELILCTAITDWSLIVNWTILGQEHEFGYASMFTWAIKFTEQRYRVHGSFNDEQRKRYRDVAIYTAAAIMTVVDPAPLMSLIIADSRE